jgi:hypothetical protein
MKQLFTFLLVAISSIIVAQAPQSIPYQAVVRNTDGSVMASTSITMTFKIHDVSATGTVVYEETHTATSNTQGLVSLNVGAGTAVTGTFAGINWGSGAKFLHVLMYTGSGNVDLGTQQMMSVPYALYSEKSQSTNLSVSLLGDSLLQGNGEYIIIPGISAANYPEIILGCMEISACNYNSNAVQSDNSCLYVNGNCNDGDSNTFNDTVDSTCMCAGLLINNSSLAIGQAYQGGVIAYLSKPGDLAYIPGETHGIIAASEDRANTEFDWACYGVNVLGAQGLNIGEGAQNTEAIVNSNCFGGAAHVCAYFAWNGYNDWYLPSRSELEELYDNQFLIGGFQNSFYWTSSEVDEFSAWIMDFTTGYANAIMPKNFMARVRPIRSF